MNLVAALNHSMKDIAAGEVVVLNSHTRVVSRHPDKRRPPKVCCVAVAHENVPKDWTGVFTVFGRVPVTSQGDLNV